MSNKIKAIKNIEDKYGAVIFGMALTHLVDMGVRHLTAFNFNEEVKQINEENEQYSLISAEFQIEIVRCATELAKFDIWDLFYYIKCYLQITERNDENG